MFVEPSIDQEALRAAVRLHYGLPVDAIRFIPRGFVTAGYRLECGGRRYFLKVWDRSRWGRISAARLGATLALADQLDALGLRVPRHLLALDGAQAVALGDLTLVLYEHLSGCPLDELPAPLPGYTARMARLVAQLHEWTGQVLAQEGESTAHADPSGFHSSALLASGPARGHRLPAPPENFQPYFLDTLHAGLEALAHLPGSARPGQRALRALLLPERARLERLVARLLDLGGAGAAVAADRQPFVLCHTDIHPANLYLLADGELCLLDWEGARLAPAEQDLFAFCGPAFPEFLSVYRAARAPLDLRVETFGYYFYYRNLEDLTDYLVKILDENSAAEQDAIDLDGIRREILPAWGGFEARMQEVAAALRAN